MHVEIAAHDRTGPTHVDAGASSRLLLEGRRAEHLAELQQLPMRASGEPLDLATVARRSFVERELDRIDDALTRILDGP
jgi:hypothetical protein